MIGNVDVLRTYPYRVLSANERNIIILEKLSSLGINVSTIQQKDTIGTLAKKWGITREILEKAELDPNCRIGMYLNEMKLCYRGKVSGKKLTEEQLEEIKNLGIHLEKRENANERSIAILEKMNELGVDVSVIKAKDTTETLAQKSNITREELEKAGIAPNIKIGSSIKSLKDRYKSKREDLGAKPTEEHLERLAKLGIDLEKRLSMNERVVTMLEKLTKLGVDVSLLRKGDTAGTLAMKSGITNEDLKKADIDPNYNIWCSLNYVKQYYRGDKEAYKPSEEQIKRLAILGISLDKIIPANEKTIENLEKLNELGVNLSMMRNGDTIETLAGKSGIPREKLEEAGFEPDSKIGNSFMNMKSRYKGHMRGQKPTEEQMERLAKLGLSLETRTRTVKEIAEVSISALADMETVDREYDVLMRLMAERNQENEDRGDNKGGNR